MFSNAQLSPFPYGSRENCAATKCLDDQTFARASYNFVVFPNSLRNHYRYAALGKFL